MRGVVVVLAWGSWRAAMHARCGGGRLGLIGGVLGPFLRTLTRQVAVWARRPHCHLKGPAAQRRASTTTCGAQLRGAGWASYGQPVADLSGAQLRRRGGNCYHRRLWAACRGPMVVIPPVWSRAVAAARSTTRRSSRNSPRLEPCRHAPMRRRPRRSPRSAHCYVSETLPVHAQEGPYRACA